MAPSSAPQSPPVYAPGGVVAEREPGASRQACGLGEVEEIEGALSLGQREIVARALTFVTRTEQNERHGGESPPNRPPCAQREIGARTEMYSACARNM